MKRKNIYIESSFLTFLLLGIHFINHFNFYFCFCFCFYFFFFFFFGCLCQLAAQVLDLDTLLCVIFLHGLHFATTLRVLKPVLCFHMTSFNYGAKGVRDVDPTCRCHQSNIMPDSIFSVNIAQCVTCS